MENGLLYFEVDVPEDADEERMLRKIAEVISYTDFVNEDLVLSKYVTPKFLPIDNLDEVNQVPVVPYEVDEDELKEIATQAKNGISNP